MTKQFKIGECAKAGIITINLDTNQGLLNVEFKDFFSKKVLQSKIFHTKEIGFRPTLLWHLENETTYYYADKIANYVDKQILNNAI